MHIENMNYDNLSIVDQKNIIKNNYTNLIYFKNPSIDLIAYAMYINFSAIIYLKYASLGVILELMQATFKVNKSKTQKRIIRALKRNGLFTDEVKAFCKLSNIYYW